MLGLADRRLFGSGEDVSPEVAVERYLPHVRAERGRGTRLATLTRPLLGLFHGRPGARAWRRTLTVESLAPGAGAEVIERALEAVGSHHPQLLRADALAAAG
jgi:tRNA-dihydrouridine synthase A